MIKKSSREIDTIRDLEDLFRHVEIKRRCFKVLGYWPNYKYDRLSVSEAHEKDRDYVDLLERLKLIKVDWKLFEKLSHRKEGNRLIPFKLVKKNVVEFLLFEQGRKSSTGKAALVHQTNKLLDKYGDKPAIDIVISFGVPSTLLKLSDNVYDQILNILIYYSSSSRAKDKKLFRKMKKFFDELDNIREIKEITFDRKQSKIIIDKEIEINIRPATKQKDFCVFFFEKKKKGEFVNWDEIFNEMKEEREKFGKRDRIMLRDVARKINNKINKKLGTKGFLLFEWSNKNIRRNY